MKMKHKQLKRLLAVGVALTLSLNMGMGRVYAAEAGSAESEQSSVTYEKLDAAQISVQTANTDNQIQENEASDTYADTDHVRVMIVLDDAAAISLADDSEVISENYRIRNYRGTLNRAQEKVADQISDEVLEGQQLDVVWNLTLIANAISANVEYGQIDEIARIDGVKSVFLETEYMPMNQADTNNIVAQEMTGTGSVKLNSGYSGAGSRVAVIDTGTDTDHQSFSEGGYEYALTKEAEEKGMSYEEYAESLGLMTEESIAKVLPQLNCYQRYDGLTAADLYLSSKLPFAFNYVDGNLDVTHDNDAQGEHGSHVAGISAANSYIDGSVLYDFDGDEDFDKDDAQALMDHAICGSEISNVEYADINSDGAFSAYDVYLLLTYLEDDPHYVSAADTVGVTGVASEAQLITMKVFGTGGGAYTSDYMAAVEDAVLLGCDVANLSLGSAYPGFIDYHTDSDDGGESEYVNGLMDSVSKTGTVMCVAAGNAGNWADNDDAFGLMYTDEAGTFNNSDPSTYTNSLAVASVDNVGSVSDCLTEVTGENTSALRLSIEEIAGGENQQWKSLDDTALGTEYDLVFLGDPSELFNGQEQTDERIYAGSGEDFADFDYTGKIVLTARGNGVYFSDKHTNAENAGAAAVLIYNNVSGSLNASIEGSQALIPCGGITLENAEAIFDLCTRDEKGVYTCKIKVTKKLNVDKGENVTYPVMSSFSSWGPTGALTIKPEITAPGGAIYSVNGALKETDGYEVMSGTSMATPHVSGLVALSNQYLKEKGLLDVARKVSGREDLSLRTLSQSLLMSTAEPLIEESSKEEYSVRNQGAGLANIQNVVDAQSFILVNGQEDGKVKAELGDGGENGWSFSFSINNLTDSALTYDLDTSVLTTGTVTAEENGTTYYLSTDEMTALGAEVTYSGSSVNGSKVTVGAGSASQVTVKIQVSAQAAEKMKSLGYTNGFYVEGYVYARLAEGSAHSIPLLGWYGNWTDPSMFDTGSYLESAYGMSERPSHIDSMVKNTLTWSPKGYGVGLYYTGNIYGGYSSGSGMIGDQRYIEARNAFNSQGDSKWDFYAIFPTLIRTVADVRIEVKDTDTGEVYFTDDFDQFDNFLIPCFYYSAYAQWVDTTSEYGIGINWDYTDQNGQPLKEDTNVTISLLCAPEYYVQEDGSVNWEELGKGADLSYRFTVDNTYPDLAGENPLTVEEKDGKPGSLKVSVQDNNYIAAVILLNGAATSIVEYYYPDMSEDEKGSVVETSFDLTDYVAKHGNKATIAICDYAGNETYYAVNLGGEGADYGEFVGFQYDPEGYGNTWVSFNSDVEKNETKLFVGSEKFVCAEYVNGYVFAQAEDGVLHAIPYADMVANTVDLETTFVTRLENVYQDLAYNYKDGKLYGLYIQSDNWGDSTEVYSIALEADEENWVEAYQEDWVMSRGDVVGLALACDDDGSLYMLATGYDEETQEDTNAQLWKASLVESFWGAYYNAFEKIGDTGLTMNYLQSMTWNHNTETLHWARFYPAGWMDLLAEVVEVNPETAECVQTGTLSAETGCLFAPLSEEAAAMEAHGNVPVIDEEVVGRPILSASSLTLNLGGTAQLTCSFDPWYSKYKDVTWSSDNEEVAVVDETGTVTGVAVGSCTVTVASKEDPSLTAVCDVVVSALSLTLDGVVSYTSGGVGSVSDSRLYHFDMENGKAEMTPQAAITVPEEFEGFGLKMASSVAAKGSVWACEFGNTGMIYQINEETGEVVDMLQPVDGDMMFGLAYSDRLDRFTGIMNYYLYVDQPLTHEAEEEILNSYDEKEHAFTWHRFDMSEYLNASQKNLVTQEEGTTGIVFCAITSIDNKSEYMEVYKDYLGGWSGSASYMPDATWVLLDNVGRLWYIDEVTDMIRSEYGDYESEDGYYISGSMAGVFAQEYIAESASAGSAGYSVSGGDASVTDVSAGDAAISVVSAGDAAATMVSAGDIMNAGQTEEEEGTSTYSVFVIRQIEETPLYNMFLNGELGITYTFSSMYYAEDETGSPMFFFSLYDYWNDAAENQLYLYIPGEYTGEYDMETWEEIKTPDALYDLGSTGEGYIIATINHAQLLGGLPESSTGEELITLYQKEEKKPEIYIGYYRQ